MLTSLLRLTHSLSSTPPATRISDCRTDPCIVASTTVTTHLFICIHIIRSYLLLVSHALHIIITILGLLLAHIWIVYNAFPSE